MWRKQETETNSEMSQAELPQLAQNVNELVILNVSQTGKIIDKVGRVFSYLLSDKNIVLQPKTSIYHTSS